MRIAFVYPNPRAQLIERIASGRAPDTSLLGQNHLAEHGIDAYPYDSFLRRTTRPDGLAHRVTWYGRELTLPWELRDTDLVVTPLATFLPLASRLRRRPRVLLFSYHLVAALDRAGSARRRLLRASMHAARGVVATAAAARTRLVEQARLDAGRAYIALLGVDADYWQPLPPAPDGHVLAVGRDLARDYETFARAVEGLPVRGVIVAKEENMRGVCIPANVDVRLNVSPDEVRELYAGASCVVVPTHPDTDPRGTESSGTISLLEAMACARPTIATARIYLRDYVHDDATLTTPTGDVRALRDAVDRVLTDGAGLGAAGRRHVEERYTTRHLAARLAEICREASSPA